MGRSRQERQLTEALSAQRLAGRREGRTEARNATYERILKTVVAGIIAKEVADVLTIVSSSGPVAALTALERLSVVEWPKVWISALSMPISALFEDVTEARQKKLISVNPAIGSMFPIVSDLPSEYRENLGKAATTSRDRIAEVLEGHRGSSVSVAAKALRDAEPELTRQRSIFIARDVLLKASKLSSYEQSKRSGVVKAKTHRHSRDERVRDEHEFVETVPINEPYQNGELWSGQLSFQCRCQDQYELDYEKLGITV